MYAIKLTPKNANIRPHIWREGYVGESKGIAEFHAKQIRKTRIYKSIQVVKLSKLLTDLLTN